MHPADIPPTFLTITNHETGETFNVRLVREGEMYGRQWVLRHEEDQPLLIFHHAPKKVLKPDRNGEFLGIALPAYHASAFLSHDRRGVDLYQTGNRNDVTPENRAEIRKWLTTELKKPWRVPPPPPPPASRRLIKSDFLLPATNERRMTIYTRGGFGWNKTEVKWVEIWRKPYTQFSNEHEVRFLPRRKKYPRIFTTTTVPAFVIALGWGHFEPRSGFQKTGDLGQSKGGAEGTIHSSRFPAFDKSYCDEFEDDLDEYLSNNQLVTVVADFRDFRATEKHKNEHANAKDTLVFSSREGVMRQYIPSDSEASPPLTISESRFLFISYHHFHDANVRKKIEGRLGEQFLSTSIYPGEISTRENDTAIRKYIKERILNCDLFLCIIGEETHLRYWVDWELHIALSLLKRKELTSVVAVFRDSLRAPLEALRGSRRSDTEDSTAEALQNNLFRDYGFHAPIRVIENVASGAIKAISVSELDLTTQGLEFLRSHPELARAGKRPVKVSTM